MLASYHLKNLKEGSVGRGVCSRELREAVCRSWPQQEATRPSLSRGVKAMLMGPVTETHGASAVYTSCESRVNALAPRAQSHIRGFRGRCILAKLAYSPYWAHPVRSASSRVTDLETPPRVRAYVGRGTNGHLTGQGEQRRG